MSRLRARCPDCRTLTAVALGPEYQCHSCGREFCAGLVRVPRAWGTGGEAMAADRVYDDVLEARGFEPRGATPDADEPESPGVAAARLRRAGFEQASASGDEVDHAFTPESFLAFLARFDDEDLFSTMDADTRTAVERELLARLRALPPGGLRLRLPIAYATARRPRRP